MVFTNKLKWFGNGEKCDITNKNFLLQQQVFTLQQLHIRLRQIKRNNKFYYDYYCYNNTNWKNRKIVLFSSARELRKMVFLKIEMNFETCSTNWKWFAFDVSVWFFTFSSKEWRRRTMMKTFSYSFLFVFLKIFNYFFSKKWLIEIFKMFTSKYIQKKKESERLETFIKL